MILYIDLIWKGDYGNAGEMGPKGELGSKGEKGQLCSKILSFIYLSIA